MGKTAFDGPAFGSQQTLCSVRVGDISSGAGDGLSSVVLASGIVPAGEDWYACELNASRGSTGSTGLKITFNDDSTQVAVVTLASSVANDNRISVITKDSAEYSGTRMASGSTWTLTVTQSSVAPASSAVYAAVSGYRRWIPSTRDV